MHHDFAEMAACLGLPEKRDVDQLCLRLSEMIGAPVELRRVEPAPGRACGTSYATWEGTRVIEYTAHINLLRERHNVLHEIGHFLIGDLDIGADHPELAAFSMLDPKAVARAFQRAPGAYATASEQTVEAFATFADALIIAGGFAAETGGGQPRTGESAAEREQRLLADYQALGPLWSMVTAVCPSVVLTPQDPAEAALWDDPAFRLARRYTEIVDALDILSRRYDAAVAAQTATPSQHNGFATPPPAVVYAAVIMQAARDELTGAPLPAAVMPRQKPQPGPCWEAMLAVARPIETRAWRSILDVASQTQALIGKPVGQPQAA